MGVVGIYFDLQGEVYPVVGSVTVDEMHPVRAIVEFYRLNADQWVVTTPTAIVDESGSFRVMSMGRRDGAAAGAYAVTLRWNPGCARSDSGPNLLPDQYALPRSTPLRVVVRPTPNRLPPFALSSRCKEALASLRPVPCCNKP
jgi:hypothetical protein